MNYGMVPPPASLSSRPPPGRRSRFDAKRAEDEEKEKQVFQFKLFACIMQYKILVSCANSRLHNVEIEGDWEASVFRERVSAEIFFTIVPRIF